MATKPKLPLKFLAAIVGLLVVVIVVLYAPQTERVSECISRTETVTVRGQSMEPLLEEGQEVRALYGYYDCNDVSRGDIVLFSYTGSETPLIKRVRALPDDTFALVESNGAWNILVNNEILKNSAGAPYALDNNAARLLQLYEHDYNGTVPENAYMLLGEFPEGSTDSTRFGLVDKSGILALVDV